MAAPIHPAAPAGERINRVAAAVEDVAFVTILVSAVALVAAIVVLALAL